MQGQPHVLGKIAHDSYERWLIHSAIPSATYPESAWTAYNSVVTASPGLK